MIIPPKGFTIIVNTFCCYRSFNDYITIITYYITIVYILHNSLVYRFSAMFDTCGKPDAVPSGT